MASTSTAVWIAVPAAGTAQFLLRCAKNPGRWFYPCSANHRDPRRCSFEFLQSSEPVHVRVEECAYTEGGTGWRVWPCALLLAGWLVAHARELQLRGCRVLELGCGLGLPALTAAALGGASTASDCLPVLLRTVERSARANGGPRPARVALFDWDDEASCAVATEAYSTEQGVKAAQLQAEPQRGAGEGTEAGAEEGAEAGAEATACARLAPSERFDLLLASDVIYSQTHARQLPEVHTHAHARAHAHCTLRMHMHAHCALRVHMHTAHAHALHTAHAHAGVHMHVQVLAGRAAPGGRLCAMVPVRSEEHTCLFLGGLAARGVRLRVATVDSAWVARAVSPQREAGAGAVAEAEAGAAPSDLAQWPPPGCATEEDRPFDASSLPLSEGTVLFVQGQFR